MANETEIKVGKPRIVDSNVRKTEGLQLNRQNKEVGLPHVDAAGTNQMRQQAGMANYAGPSEQPQAPQQATARRNPNAQSPAVAMESMLPSPLPPPPTDIPLPQFIAATRYDPSLAEYFAPGITGKDGYSKLQASESGLTVKIQNPAKYAEWYGTWLKVRSEHTPETASPQDIVGKAQAYLQSKAAMVQNYMHREDELATASAEWGDAAEEKRAVDGLLQRRGTAGAQDEELQAVRDSVRGQRLATRGYAGPEQPASKQLDDKLSQYKKSEPRTEKARRLGAEMKQKRGKK